MPRDGRGRYRPLTEDEISEMYKDRLIKPFARPLYLYNERGNLCPSRRLPSWTNHVLDFKKKQKKLARLSLEGDFRSAKKLAHRLFRSQTARTIAARKALRTIPAEEKGPDRPTVDAIANALRHTSFTAPSTVRVQATHKSNGGLRISYGYSVFDRAFQILVSLTFGQLITFHPAQHGVPGASRQKAVRTIRNYIKTRRYKFGLEADISNFFPSIDTSRIQQALGIPGWVLTEIATNKERSFYVPGNKLALLHWNQIPKQSLTQGLPQGAATSPIFAYGLLKSVLDQFDASDIEGVKIVNYCDNFLILGESKERVGQAFETLKRLLSGGPVVSLVLRQCGGTRQLSNGIDFIGFRFRKKEGYPIVDVSSQKMTELRKKFREYKNLSRWSVGFQFLMQKTLGDIQDIEESPQNFEQHLMLLYRDRYLYRNRKNPHVQQIAKYIRDRRPSDERKLENTLGRQKVRRKISQPSDAVLGIPPGFSVRKAEDRLKKMSEQHKAETAEFVARVVKEMKARHSPSTTGASI